MAQTIQLTPRQRANFSGGYQPTAMPPEQEGWLQKLMGSSNIKSGPSLDAQGNIVLATPKTGFLTQGSQRAAAAINAPLIALMKQLEAQKEMLGSEQSHDVNMMNVAAAIAKSGLSDQQKASIAGSLNIPIENVDQLTSQLVANADQRLKMQGAAEGKSQAAQDEGAAMRAIGYDPNKAPVVPAGAVSPYPASLPNPATLSGAITGPGRVEQALESEIPIGKGQTYKTYKPVAVPGDMIRGGFSPAINPQARASMPTTSPASAPPAPTAAQPSVAAQARINAPIFGYQERPVPPTFQAPTSPTSTGPMVQTTPGYDKDINLLKWIKSMISPSLKNFWFPFEQ